MRPVVTVPVLSSTTVSTWRVDSRTSGPLMRMPSCAPRPGADQQRGGRGQPEGARAGDDQHGDRGGEGGGAGLAGAQPEPERADGERDHDGHEHRRHPVGQPLHRRLARLGRGHEAGDLGQGGVGADAGGLDHEPAAGVDGGAGDRVPGADLDRHRLAGEQRRVDGRRALLDDAVGGDLLAGADDEAVAHGELGRSGRRTSAPSRSTATSLAPRSSSARKAAPERFLARASK